VNQCSTMLVGSKRLQARPRLYNVSVRGSEIFDHINLLQVFIRS
jgi:hypothetical protein